MPTSKSSNKWIGITLGDPAGIGPEVTAKALDKPSINRLANFKIIGDYTIYRKYASGIGKNCLFIDTQSIANKKLKPGKMSRIGAKASMDYLQKAIALIKNGEISSLVTAPVCKEAIFRMDSSFQGHTELLANAFCIKHPGMLFVAGPLRSIIVTRHIPIAKVSRTLNAALVYETIKLTHHALRKQFRIKRPHIAVCGLNPHAGEGGILGHEEKDIILPAIQRAKRRGMAIDGPFPADTLYSPHIANRYAAIVAMYHDQGLIPVKAMHFSKLVNLTIGLPFVRTSPAHGTAFDLAGKNKCDPSSMCAAIALAAQLHK